ncbi:amino acid carrier protein [Gammaproteobacteria bacterium]|nr:amino acid carrier protein [Gammaproteobacteria bacterium]
MEYITNYLSAGVDFANYYLWDILIILLLGVGILFTLTTGFVQLRLLPQSVKEIFKGSSKTNSNAITPFQAFATGLASRVGVGNIGGVAIAISIGGPGAIFWMWVTALLGMSSAFAESSLAQLFKIKDNNGQYRGGPAYYIQRGLNQRWLGILFALSLILAFGFVFNAVQSNSIVAATRIWNWNSHYVGLGLVLLSAPIIFGGIKRVARTAEKIVPIMAFLYLGLTVYIIMINLGKMPHVFGLIFDNAFGAKQAAGGIFGGLFSQAMLLGIKRGLFSNEAGMGSAPNAAAAAEVAHPVSQGLIQMLGVLVDTLIVCSATAVIILLSEVHLSTVGVEGVELTQAALKSEVGIWGSHFLAVVLFMFAFSSIIGNYAYAESNVQFIKNDATILTIFRCMVLGMVYFGAVQKIDLVWNMADLSMGIMATINLIAIALLAPLVWRLLADYQKQRRAGKEPKFDIKNHPDLRAKLGDDVW